MSATCAAGHELAQAGRPCRACRVGLVVDRVVTADPSVPVDDARAAVDAVAAHPATLRELTRVLADGPGPLLVGAPGTVGRLVVELRARGSALPDPVCVRCGRTGRELIFSSEGGVCSRCRNHQLASSCAVCGVTKPVAGRDADRRPLCAVCAPRPKRPCARCGQVRIIARRARGGDGDLCDGCYKGPLAVCGVCGKTKVCSFVAEGRPICASCLPRRHLACAHCGQQRPPTARWPEGPVCEPCYRAALNRRGVCVGCSLERRLVHPPGPRAARCADCAGVGGLACCAACGIEQRPYRHGLCVQCALSQRAREVLGDADGPLAAVGDALVAASQPYSAHNWLRSGVSAGILADIASGALPLTHEALDAHPRRRAASYLRHILVAHGALPTRHDAIVRLEAWVADRLASVSAPEQRRLLRSYATWRVLRRARQRAEAARRPAPTARAKTCLNAAIAFLAFLDTHRTDLARCTQAHIDTWLSTGPPSAPEIADFVDWAKGRHLLVGVVVPARPRNHGPALDDDTRWKLVRRVLHDNTLELGDRVAGSLVLLYGQQISRIVTISRTQIRLHDDTVRLYLGATHIDVPQPLAGLLTRLAHTRRPNTSVAAVPTSPWLFPGVDPGQPLNAAYLGQRLRRLGIPTMPSRRSALTHLASRLPAAVLADLLGIAPTTAVHWVRTAGGDWNTYAAQLIHDRDRKP